MREDQNESGSSFRPSYIVAGIIFLMLSAWIFSGQLNRLADFAGSSKPDETKKAAAQPAPTVRVRTVKSERRASDLIIRGRTQAIRKVLVKAEVAGAVSRVSAEKGQRVKAGDVLCELNVDSRAAQLKMAQASMRQRQIEYEASKTLQEKGFRSDTAVAADLAEYEGAKADVERMEKQFADTKIRAPFDGVVDDRLVEVGDYMQPGSPCAMVVDQHPMLVIGQVSENNVTSLKIGDVGWARLITGERAEGRVRFVAQSADAATRTFRVELEVPNEANTIRDGVTAEIHISSRQVEAHRISPAILALDDRGVVGVRIVERGNRVRFVPVTIVSDSAEGMWVTGLPPTVVVITVGQEYVTNGQVVNPIPEDKGTQT